jgi:hypothetical protein
MLPLYPLVLILGHGRLSADTFFSSKKRFLIDFVPRFTQSPDVFGKPVFLNAEAPYAPTHWHAAVRHQGAPSVPGQLRA